MLISVKNLCKEYDNEGIVTRALCGVTFDIADGEFVSIMGPSGSGKSTLMQLLGFLDRPTDGEYFFQGKDTKNFSDDDLAFLRNQKIGFVFQSFNLLPRTTVFENVELPLLYDERKESRGLLNRKVHDALRSVNLENRISNFSNQLSGGEQQRVAIARALVNDPALILADEPTGNLDSKNGLQIMRILQRLNNDGHTIVMVTHETYTSEHAKRIIQMLDGKVENDYLVKKRRIADGEEELLK
ncbi:MAG: ABC transporter related protein [Candidatus Moranbacteria bacterium GW2011_GWC1_45_18]|nr:MAG: ABC-type transport system, involved in lipoprotein release, ATPase component [Candidatus Moranbacteria bacterium GW2011_GWC2_40_12]KKT32186.1 MAG: ABC-type transport system, involved in lipoprotein release, ATPase component [Candidatus Moranbacteria bacterium GW2011_GWF2_44_10]KKT72233.1 MAG: ABC-type transport system, involved in lipoprotein release, ATPase component [Candidatus Moranbacteria bacterium GW2011_GWF1_44_4]KKT99890.1 MAG: ABC transporter related protein [Candidatus Moranbac